jgi:hypothetical protein
MFVELYILSLLYRRPESNRHSVRNTILSRARLPIPPRRHLRAVREGFEPSDPFYGINILAGCRFKPSSATLPYFTAEEEGFEPPDLLQSSVFKTDAINHSTTLPLSLNITLFCFKHKYFFGGKRSIRNPGLLQPHLVSNKRQTLFGSFTIKSF